jgi:hypothetical protein
VLLLTAVDRREWFGRARDWPRRQLPAMPLLTSHVDHHAQRYDRGHEQGDGRENEGQERRHVIWARQQDGRNHADRGDDHPDANPDILARRRPGRCVHPADGEIRDERG